LAHAPAPSPLPSIGGRAGRAPSSPRDRTADHASDVTPASPERHACGPSVERPLRRQKTMKDPALLGLAATATLPLLGCAQQGAAGATIAADGASTVFPITEAVAEEFQQGRSDRATIGVSGTGAGFKKLCNKEVALVGASRPIEPSEVTSCQ